MGKTNQSASQLLRVIFNRQAYQNLIYLGAAFPLSIFTSFSWFLGFLRVFH